MLLLHGIYFGAWSAAALLWMLCGARALARREPPGGMRERIALHLLPMLAVAVAYAGARVHFLLRAPGLLVDDLLDGALRDVLFHPGGLRIGGGLVAAALFLRFVGPVLVRHRLSGWQVLDVIVPHAGLAIAVGRLGCFAAGCCFGVPCTGAACVRYPAGSAAYWNHVAQGWLVEGAARSLAVHALPLYLSGAALAASAAAGAAGKLFRREGSPTIAFVVVLAGSRLLIEPLRETSFDNGVPGQRGLDLALLAVMGALLGFRAYRASRGGASLATLSTAESSSPGMPRL
jgi:phosphatidylglycerol:prolipoprotein diacylglycerol transferase